MNTLSRLPLALAAMFVAALASAQTSPDFSGLIADSDTRIEQSLQDYQAFLEQTSTEKIELVSKINKLENTLVRLRNEQRNAEQLTAKKKLDLEDLNERIGQLDTQTQYSSGVLSEYLTNFESRTNIAEDQYYLDTLRSIRQRIEKVGDLPNDRLPVYFQALDAGLARQEMLIGGRVFPGRAITPNGGVKSGSVAIIGPVAYFSAADGSAAGVLKFNSGTIEPGLAPLLPESAGGLTALLASGQGTLPLDASLGKALALKQAKGTLVEHIEKGGWVGYAILLLGALSIIVAGVKAIDLQSTKSADPGDIGDIARAAINGGAKAAREKVGALTGPIAAMIATGIDFARADTETIVEAMETVILRHRPRLERFLPFLATTAAVAPLMGLLGTVVGMIKTFTLIEVFGTGDAKSLSSGISEALVTTELGLIVAIPALILHGVFTRIMRSRIGNMEQVAADFGRHVALEREHV